MNNLKVIRNVRKLTKQTDVKLGLSQLFAEYGKVHRVSRVLGVQDSTLRRTITDNLGGQIIEGKTTLVFN